MGKAEQLMIKAFCLLFTEFAFPFIQWLPTEGAIGLLLRLFSFHCVISLYQGLRLDHRFLRPKAYGR
jgi:LytS/YehU family sensor histidine kinase